MFIPSLDKVSANDKPLYTQIGSNACIFKTDWLQILEPRLFRTSLHTFQPGHKGDYGKILNLQLQQSDALTLRWADVFYNHTTLLSSDW